MRHAWTPASRERGELLGELLGGPTGSRSRSISSGRWIGRHHPFSHDPVGLGVVIGDVEPHRRERVRERRRHPCPCSASRLAAGPRARRTASGVVLYADASQPSARRATRRKPGLRPPAADPDRWAFGCAGRGSRRCLRSSRSGRRTARSSARHSAAAPTASSRRAHRSAKSMPTAVVVLLRRARTHRHHQPPVGQPSIAASVLARAPGPGRPEAPPWSRASSSPSAPITAASAVGPSSHGTEKTRWSFADSAVKPERGRGLGVLDEMIEGVRVAAEVHQRQMGPEVHLVSLPGTGPVHGGEVVVSRWVARPAPRASRRENAVALGEELGDLVPIDARLEHHAYDGRAPRRLEEGTTRFAQRRELGTRRLERQDGHGPIGRRGAGVPGRPSGVDREHVRKGVLTDAPPRARPTPTSS